MSDTTRCCIYVVDDEQIIASTIARILEQKGYAARPFSNPFHVLEASASCVPSLLISDVVMPQMTGVELAAKMRELYPSCRVILFSGHSATSVKLKDALGQGYSFDILAKPIHPIELLERVAEVMGHRTESER